MKRIIGAVTALSLFLQAVQPAFAAGSTINVGIPAQGSPLASQPMRNNFAAAASDINNLMSMFAGNSPPASPSTFQFWANPSVNPAPINLYDGTQQVTIGYLDRVAHSFTPVVSSTAITSNAPITTTVSSGVATLGLSIDSNFTVMGGALALNPIAAGDLMANCGGSTAEPSFCSWNSFANQAIGNTNGIVPYRIGGAWSTNTATAAPTASALAIRDTNANIFSNNFIFNSTSTASAGGTTVLTNASSRYQLLTGTLNQIYQLPDATTLTIGFVFEFNNNSTGTLSIVDNGSNAIATVPAGGYAHVSPNSISTSNGVWDKHYLAPLTVSWGNAGLTLGTSGSTPGQLSFVNATSGIINLQPPTGALGTQTLTLPDVTDTLAGLTASQAFTNKTYNGLSITTTTGTLTVASGKTLTANNSLTLAGVDGKTLTINNSLTFAGTDATTMTFPSVSATLAALGVAQTFSANQTFGANVTLTTIPTGTCASGLGVTAAGLIISGVCPGAASSISAGGGSPTSVTNATSGNLLYANGTSLGNVALAGGTGITLSGTANSTIGLSTITGPGVLGATGNGSGQTVTTVQTPVLLFTQTVSGVSNISDTTHLTAAGYSHFELRLIGLIPSTNASSCILLINSGGLQNTNYTASSFRFQAATAASGGVTTYIPCDSSNNLESSSGGGLTAYITFPNPSQTATHKQIKGDYTFEATSGGNAGGQIAGEWTGGTGAITGFQVCFGTSAPTCAGTLSGIYEIWGYP